MHAFWLITRFRRRVFHTLRSAGATPSQATLVHTPHTSGKRGQQVCDENEALALIFTGGLHRRHGSFGGAVVRAQTVQRDWTHHRRDRPYVHASLVWSCPDPRTDHSSPVPPPAAAERGARAPVFPKLCGTARHGAARAAAARCHRAPVRAGRPGRAGFVFVGIWILEERTAYVSRPAGLGPHTYTYHTMRVLLGLELKKKIPREHTYCTVRTHPCNSSSLDVRLHAPLFCCLSNPLFWLLASFSRGTRITAQTNHRVHVKRASVSLRARPSAGAGERARRAARVCDRFIGSFVYLN